MLVFAPRRTRSSARSDQDVILQRGWLAALLAGFDDPEVAAVAGTLRHPARAPASGHAPWGATSNIDTRTFAGGYVDHVCTGNTAYRARALHQVALLDENLGYGYDNDLSYRLHGRGYRLLFCREAISVHCWREGFAGYVRQQFGVGYGRLDVVARHPRRITGDDVSGTLMMLHAPAMLCAVAAVVAAAFAFALGNDGALLAAAGGAATAGLAVERAIGGVNAWRRTGDRAALGFSIAHLVRDLAWAMAIVSWSLRWALKRDRAPAHSMHRPAGLPVDRRAASAGLAEDRSWPSFRRTTSAPTCRGSLPTCHGCCR